MKILKFTASWCQPCRHMDNIIFDLSEEHRNLFESIDVESESGIELAEDYRVKSVPTLVFLDNDGREVLRHIGLMTKSLLESTINDDKNKNDH